MSLILFAFVARVRDGLPLSASTDFEHNKELQERKQQLKTISKALALFPQRGTVKGRELNIYFISSDGVSYMAVCSCRLPTAMAFCFLEDLRWEFTAYFDSTTVSLANRPYPFLEFDSVIQKVKHHYSQSGSPSLGSSLAELQEELRTKPPTVLNLEDMELSNGMANGHVDSAAGSVHTGADGGKVMGPHTLFQCSQWLLGKYQGPNQRLEPVTAPGILSLVLNIMCAALNLIRGVHLIEYTFQDDNEGIWNVIAFLFAFVCCLCQCYLYVFYTSLKKLKSFTLLTLIVLCNIFLYGLRNSWQLAFHITVASISTCLILSRKLQERTADCGV